ncbi:MULTISPECIES: hypothetical protein [unclassified Streptomyces]|uniref:hypothetical protein n=1 Tax=unclassified Streptomyces TaxID=2593676 RepID=UPI0033A96A97
MTVQILLVGLRGPGGFLRADSVPLSDSDAQQQLTAVAEAKKAGPDTMLQLPWLVVASGDVVFGRLVPMGGP